MSDNKVSLEFPWNKELLLVMKGVSSASKVKHSTKEHEEPPDELVIEKSKAKTEGTKRVGKGDTQGRGGQFAKKEEKATGNEHVDKARLAFRDKERARTRYTKKKNQLSKMSQSDPKRKEVETELSTLKTERDSTLATFKGIKKEAKEAGVKIDSRGNLARNQPKPKKNKDTSSQIETDKETIRGAVKTRDDALVSADKKSVESIQLSTEAEKLNRSKAHEKDIRDAARRITAAETPEAKRKAGEEYWQLEDMVADMRNKASDLRASAIIERRNAWQSYQKDTHEAHGRLLEHHKVEGLEVQKKLTSPKLSKRFEGIDKRQKELEATEREAIRLESHAIRNARITKKNMDLYRGKVKELDRFLSDTSGKTQAEIDSSRTYRSTMQKKFDEQAEKNARYNENKRVQKERAKQANRDLTALVAEKEALTPRELLRVDNPLNLQHIPIGTQKLSKAQQVVVNEGFQELNLLIDSTVFPSTTTIAVRKKGSKLGRASAELDLPVINVYGKSDKYTVAHEVAHQVEYGNPRVLRDAVDFWHARTGNTANGVKRIPGYKIGEWGDPDDFPNPYDGKVYRNADEYKGIEATEIVSRGIEYMADNPIKFATDDPDFFAFIYAVSRSG